MSMEKPTEKKDKRAEDQTTITFSLPKKLREAIEAAAEAEDRNISNFLVKELKGILADPTRTPTKKKP